MHFLAGEAEDEVHFLAGEAEDEVHFLAGEGERQDAHPHTERRCAHLNYTR